MRYTIITPTIQRESLIRTCESVNSQTCTDWEHIVVIDCKEASKEIVDKISRFGRTVLKCNTPHANGGNTCRHNAWEYAHGDYVYYLDDDNYLSDDRVLEDMRVVTGKWALFPILRFGRKFYYDPPQMCLVDTGNVLVQRDIARWPDIPTYESDGVFIESLKRYEYDRFPSFRPIMIMDSSGKR